VRVPGELPNITGIGGQFENNTGEESMGFLVGNPLSM